MVLKNTSIFRIKLLIVVLLLDESINQLIPTDHGNKIHQKVTYFRYQLDQIQSGIITLGSFFHEEYVGRPKIPFIKPVRTAMKSNQY